MGDIQVLNHLMVSMDDAIAKLETAVQQNKIQDFNKLKAFILDIQSRIKVELAKRW